MKELFQLGSSNMIQVQTVCLSIIIAIISWSGLLSLIEGTKLFDYKKLQHSGPLQILGPSPQLIEGHARMSEIKCASKCSHKATCTGFSFNQGSHADGSGLQCWMGTYDPDYVVQSGDAEHPHPIWIKHQSKIIIYIESIDLRSPYFSNC